MRAGVAWAGILVAAVAASGAVVPSAGCVPPGAFDTLHEASEWLDERAQDPSYAADAALMDAVDDQRRNLEAAQSLLSLVSACNDDLVSLGFSLAAQSNRLLVPNGVHDVALDARAPSAAMAAVLHRWHIVPTPHQQEALAALDELPASLGQALAAVADAYLAFDEANTRTQRELTVVPSTTAFVLEGYEPLFEARARLLAATRDLYVAASTRDWSVPAALTNPVVFPPALILDVQGTSFTCATTPYVVDVALSIDLGGGDCYENNAGGSRIRLTGPASNTTCQVLLDPLPPTTSHTQAAGVLIDFPGADPATAGDFYGNSSSTCGVNGGGYHGAGFLVDVAGNDVYRVGRSPDKVCVKLENPFNSALITSPYSDGTCGANGGGHRGAGFLLDIGGPDAYANDQAGFGVNGGAAYAGTGMLVDAGLDSESDAYRSKKGGVNGGAHLLAAGFLLDVGGTDLYTGGAPGDASDGGPNGAGANGGGDGGRGFLLDVTATTIANLLPGGDSYAAGPEGTNGGARRAFGNAGCCIPMTNIPYPDFVPGTGFLMDVGGTDHYTASRYGTNGGADQELPVNDDGILGLGPAGGVGMLIDTGASSGDTYQDGIPRLLVTMGRSIFGSGDGMDCTKAPKGPLGLQLDDTPVTAVCPDGALITPPV